MSYRIILHYITLCCIASYHAILYHIILYHVILYYIISYYIGLYHIILYYIIYALGRRPPPGRRRGWLNCYGRFPKFQRNNIIINNEISNNIITNNINNTYSNNSISNNNIPEAQRPRGGLYVGWANNHFNNLHFKS